MRENLQELFKNARPYNILSLRKFMFLYIVFVIGFLIIIVSSEDREVSVADICESSCYSGCIGEGGTPQYCETFCDNELTSCVDENLPNPRQADCERVVSQQFNECLYDIDCVDMQYDLCEGQGPNIATAPDEVSWEWDDCWNWCQESSYGLNKDTTCQKNGGAHCWLVNPPSSDVNNCEWTNAGGPPDPLGGYCELDEEAFSQRINNCINSCGEYHNDYPTICSDACNEGVSSDCSETADVDFPQNYCYDNCIEVNEGDSAGCTMVCDIENSSSQCEEQSYNRWGDGGDELLCHNNETSFCTNHGGIALTAPAEEAGTWESCWNWCQENWSSDYPICQKNSGNWCWLNYAPEGGVEGCIWDDNGSDPYGGYCELTEGEGGEGGGDMEYCGYLDEEMLVSSELYCEELTGGGEEKESECAGEEGYPDPESSTSFCTEPSPSACERACMEEGYSLSKCSEPCSKLENVYENCYSSSGNDCESNSSCYSNCMESVNNEFDCNRFCMKRTTSACNSLCSSEYESCSFCSEIEDPVEIPNDSRVGYWELESNTEIIDSEGYAQDGIIHGDISLVESPNGYIGNAIDTGDPSGYIEIEDNQNIYDFSSENAFTVEAWVKKEDFTVGDSHPRIVAKEDSDGDFRNWLLGVNSTSVFCELEWEEGGYGLYSQDQSEERPIDGQWNQIACVWDGNFLKTVLNGEIIASAEISENLAPSSGNLFIGSGHDGGRRFEGKIDEVSIYNYAKVYDSDAPEIVLNASTKTFKTTFYISGQVTDVVGVENIQSQLNSTEGSWTDCTCRDGNCDSPEENFICAVAGYSNGYNDVYLRAEDSEGNVTESGGYIQHEFEYISEVGSTRIGHWELESNTEIIDSEEYAPDGIIHGDISIINSPNGHTGNAINTGELSGYIQIDDSAGLYSFDGFDSEYTLEAWVKKEDFSNGGRVITKENSEGDSSNIFLHVDGTNGVDCKFRADDDYSTRSADFSLTYMPNDGEWNHVACVWDGSRLYSVLNEKIVGSRWYDGRQIEASTGDVYIGSGRGGMYRFEGLIDDVSVYNYAKDFEEFDRYGPMIEFDALENSSRVLSKRPTLTGTMIDQNNIVFAEYAFTQYDIIPYGTSIEDYVDFQTFYPDDGNWDSSDESFTIQPNEDLGDGEWMLFVRAEDSNGNVNTYREDGWISVPCDNQDYCMGVYRFVVEADDTTAPNIEVHEVIPYPTTDKTPTVTGYVKDDDFDTPSVITNIQYNINGGEWQDIVPKDGIYDEVMEEIELELEELSIGTHTLTIRAVDSSGNDTNSEDKNHVDSFEIINQPEGIVPEIIERQESFDSHDYHDTIFTDGIWGNGIGRIKQDIDFEADHVYYGNKDNYGYDSSDIDGFTVTESVDGNLWGGLYGGAFFYHNISNGETTRYAPPKINHRFHNIVEFERLGQRYLILTYHNSGTIIYDINNTPEDYSDDFWVEYSGDEIVPLYASRQWGEVTVDTRGDTLGYYFLGREAPNGDRIFYVDTNDTIMDLTDDTLVSWGESDGLTGSMNITGLLFDLEENMWIAKPYENGRVHVCNDAGTPMDKSDDSCSTSENITGSQAFSIIKDNNGLFWMGGDNGLYLYDTKGTINTSDDNSIQHLSVSQLSYERIMEMGFIEGEYPVGDEIVMLTREGHVRIYENNFTIDDRYDDTYHDFDFTHGNYVSDIYMHMLISDRNTIWINQEKFGFFKVNLNRSFEEENIIQALPTPPSGRLEINHVSLVDVNTQITENNNVPNFRSGLVGRVSAQGPDYSGLEFFVSNNAGNTWKSIEVGDTISFESSDYRLKFKVILTKIGESTPILDFINFSFASYPAPPVDEDEYVYELDYPSQVSVGSTFDLDIQALDELGFLISTLDTDIDIVLLNSDNSVSSSECLSLVDETELVNGMATVQVSALCEGTFKFKIDDGEVSGIGDNITILSSSDPVCGDGTLDSGEECDDGNNEDGDGCSAQCEDEFISPPGNLCGDGTVDDGEECDDGNNEDRDGCSAECEIEPSVCGNGIVEQGEDCDGIIENNQCGEFEDYKDYKGNVICSDECTYDYSNCFKETPIFQGNQESVFEDVTEALTGQELPETGPLSKVMKIATIGTAGVMSTLSILFAFPAILKRKEENPWGIVVDKNTGKPVAFATVRLYKDKELVEQKVTDIEGRYGFVVEDDKYYIEVSHDTYKDFSKSFQLKKEGLVNLDIQLQPLDETSSNIGFKIKEKLANAKEVFPVLTKYIYIVGFVWTLLTTIYSPIVYNILVLAFYVVLGLVYLFKSRKRGWGKVLDSENDEGIAYASVKLFDLDNKKLINTQLTNTEGQYVFIAERGNYGLLVVKSGFKFPSAKGKLDLKKSYLGEVVKVKLDESGKVGVDIYLDPKSKKSDQRSSSEIQKQYASPFKE